MKNQKTYLVTGVAGFIASQTAELLLEQGHRVIGVDNLNDYYDIRLKIYRLEKLLGTGNRLYERPKVEDIDLDATYFRASAESIRDGKSMAISSGDFHFYRLDIEDLDALKELFEAYSFDAILNLAARAGVRYSLENPHVYMTTNGNATLNLLECMRQFSVKKMVLASTSSLYAGQKMPFTEDLAVNTPISPYAASKKAAEAMAYSYHYLFDLDISVCRYFTVFGPCGRPDMCLFRFIKWIQEDQPIELFGDGEQSRDFTFVQDIARGTIAALKEVGYEVFNLGGGNNPVSLNTLIGWLEEQLNKKASLEYKPFHKADILTTWANIDKAKQYIDWEPKTDVFDGVVKTVKWHQAEDRWLKNIVI